MCPPCPEQTGNENTKCVTNVERYTRYNPFELTIATLQHVCAAWQAILYLEVESRKRQISDKLSVVEINK